MRVEDKQARIDYVLCIACGMCATKCRKGVIHDTLASTPRPSREETMAATAKAPAEYRFTVNGEEQVVAIDKPLLRYLRDDLKLTSVKDGCSEGACGTCTVLVDDRATKACVLTTRLAAGRSIVTVEGLPHEEQEAFVYAFGAVGAVQCGFCIPGMVMAGAALIHKVPDPTEDQVKVAIRGNVCRCTGYKKIIEASCSPPRSCGARRASTGARAR